MREREVCGLYCTGYEEYRRLTWCSLADALRQETLSPQTCWSERRTEGSGGVVGVQTPSPHPPEIRKAHQNRAKLNPIVKTVKNC